MPEPDHDVFVFYAEPDRAWAQGFLVTALRQAGLRVLHELRLGAPRLQQFEEAVERSGRVLLVLSPAWLADEWAQYVDVLAAHFGAERGTWPVVPIVISPVELPLRLRQLVQLDASRQELWEPAVARLCTQLQASGGPLAAVLAPTCPYPGLAPYTEAEADTFFGREEETSELVQRLRLTRLQLVIGASGTGKSSLVRAGLVRALGASRLFEGEWTVRYLRPGRQPLAALRTALGTIDDVEDAPSAARRLVEAGPGCLLVIVDQLEELFTVATSGVRDFAAALPLLAQVERCHVVTTLRADFFSELLASDLWPAVEDARLELRALSGSGLRRAVSRPAEDVGVFVEAALVERLVADAGAEPGALPLLQETLVLLWEGLQRRLLPISAYTSLVLSRTAYGAEITGLQVAMARRANAALAELDEAERMVARRILLRLVQFGQGRRDVRRQQPRAALLAVAEDGPTFDRVLEHLVRHRLLTTSGVEECDVDLAHEALATSWPTFRTWLTERRDAEVVRRRLLASAEEWLRHGRSGGRLDEVELTEAERWLEGPDAAALGVDAAVLDLVEASRTAVEQAAREARSGHERELAAANALAGAERERGLEQARGARRLRRLVAVLAVFGLLAAGLGAAAETQRRTAETLGRLALARQLAAQARQLPAGQLDLALLLAAQSQRVSETADGRDSLLALLSRAAGQPRFLHISTGQLYGVAAAPDGSAVYVADVSGSLSKWDLATGRPTWRVRDADALRALSLSPDGRVLATGDENGLVRLWQAADGRPVGPELRGHTGIVRSVSFSPDGRSLASGGNDATVHLWDVATGGLRRAPLRGHTDWVQSVVWSPDGGTLATGAGRAGGGAVDTSVRLWDVVSGGVLRTWGHHDTPVRALAYSPDGTTVASADEEGRIVFTDAGTGLRRASSPLGQPQGVLALSYSQDGSTLASGGAGQQVRLWRTTDGTLVGEPLTGHAQPVRSLSAGPNGLLVSAGDDGRVALWSLGDGPVLAETLQAGAPARGLVVGDDGLLAWGGASGPRAGATTGGTRPGGTTPQVTLPADALGQTLSLARLPGTRDLLVGEQGGRLVLLSADTGRPGWSVDTGHGNVFGVAASPDGRTAATAGPDGAVRLWDTATGALVGDELAGDGQWLWDVAFSPDGGTVAAVGLGEQVLLWDLRSAIRARTVLGRTRSQITSVAWAPDGQGLAAGSGSGAVHVWRWSGAAPTEASPDLTLSGFQRYVWSVAYDRSGGRLGAGGEDGSVRLWDLPSGRQLGEALTAGPEPVHSVAFSPGGERLLAAGGAGVVSWDIEPRSLEALACRLAGRPLTERERDTLLGGWSGAFACER